MTGKIVAIDISGSHLLQKQAEVDCFTWQTPLRQMMAAVMKVGIFQLLRAFQYILSNFISRKLSEVGFISHMRKKQNKT